MRARAPRILMVGTALDGRGGVAAVLSVLRASGLFEREAVHYVSTHREGGMLAKLVHAGAGLWATLRTCLLRRPAIVHAHVSSGASFVRKSLVLLVARASGCKTIFHLHGGSFRQYALEHSGVLMRRWIRHTIERSSLVIALSDSWAAFLSGFAPKARVAVVPNAVPMPAAPATTTIATADAGAPGTPVAAVPDRILFLGRIEPAKGTAELLDAVARLAPRFPQLRLVMGGSGDLDGLRRAAAERGIDGRIDLPGWLDAAARDAELACASVFCLPSHAEGLPMAVLEAMAAGKAVVASKVGGLPELIRDGENGLLVPPRDAAALAQALARLLDDAGLRSRLGAAARGTVETQYSTQAVCGRLAAIYNDLAGTR